MSNDDTRPSAWTARTWTLGQAQGCVGPGWAELVKRCWDATPQDCSIAQVKEKFGGLRFYIDAAPDEVWDIIEAAENESFRVCEQCGAPGEPRHNGWIKTLCDVHARKSDHE